MMRQAETRHGLDKSHKMGVGTCQHKYVSCISYFNIILSIKPSEEGIQQRGHIGPFPQ